MERIKRIGAYPSAAPVDLGVHDIDPPIDEPVEMVFVPNALVGCYGHITSNFQNVEIVSYPQHRNSIGLKGVLSNYLVKKRIEVDRPAVSILSGWSDGYYHFTLESLLKLFVVRDHIDGATIVLPARPQKFQKEWLDLLGYTDITHVEPKELVRTPVAISSNFPASGQNHHNLILPEFRRWVLDKIEDRPQKAFQKIFVGRRSGSQRNLINQDELASVLASKGFAFILTDDYSLQDQVNMFRGAEMIVAVHGAALANLAFSSQKIKVIDLIHKEYDQQCFLKLSTILDIDYSQIQCNGEMTNKEDARFKDFVADIDTVVDRISRW